MAYEYLIEALVRFGAMPLFWYIRMEITALRIVRDFFVDISKHYCGSSECLAEKTGELVFKFIIMFIRFMTYLDKFMRIGAFWFCLGIHLSLSGLSLPLIKRACHVSVYEIYRIGFYFLNCELFFFALLYDQQPMILVTVFWLTYLGTDDVNLGHDHLKTLIRL